MATVQTSVMDASSNRHRALGSSDVKESNGTVFRFQNPRNSRAESISSDNTSIDTSRSSSFDDARDDRKSRKISSPLPTPIETSRSSRFRPPPLSPRSFRSSSSSRHASVVPLKSDGLPKPRSPHSSLYSRRWDSKRSPPLSGGQSPPAQQSPPFSPRSFKSIFSGSNVQSPGAASQFSTTTTIRSQPDPDAPAPPPGQTVATKVFDRSIPRSKQNRTEDTPPLPTPSFFEPHAKNLDTAPPASSAEALEKEPSGPLSKLASKFKSVLGGGSAGQKGERRKKSLDKQIKPKPIRLVTEKVEDVHWTEM